MTVGVVGVLQDAYVDPDDVLRLVGLLRWLSVDFDTKGGEPLAGWLLLERDLFQCGVVGDLSVETDRYVREFREGQDSLTALLVELEARLVVRETAKLPWRLPFELTDAVAVLFECGGY